MPYFAAYNKTKQKFMDNSHYMYSEFVGVNSLSISNNFKESTSLLCFPSTRIDWFWIESKVD